MNRMLYEDPKPVLQKKKIYAFNKFLREQKENVHGYYKKLCILLKNG